MHYLVFEINFQMHFISLISLVSIHLLIHFSTHLCHHSTLVIHHSFSLSLQAQNLPFQQILSTLDYFYSCTYWTAFVIMGLDHHAHQLIFNFAFYLFIFVYSVW